MDTEEYKYERDDYGHPNDYYPKQQKQATCSKQELVHEAQLIDSYRRVMIGINRTAKAINYSPHTKDDELNNLKLQMEIASSIFHDKKRKYENEKIVNKLKYEFNAQISSLPRTYQFNELNACINTFKTAFDCPLVPGIFKVTGGGPMSGKDQRMCFGSLNYANIMTDQMKVNAKYANSAEDLTTFKARPYNPANPTYVDDYEMVDEQAKVYEGYGNNYRY